jgi:hypothetical protein
MSRPKLSSLSPQLQERIRQASKNDPLPRVDSKWLSHALAKRTVPPALVRVDQGAQRSAAGGAARPHVSFTLYRCGTLLDWDQKYSSVKWVLDALVEERLLPGDREEDITGEVRQIRVAHRAEQKTVLTISYP